MKCIEILFKGTGATFELLEKGGRKPIGNNKYILEEAENKYNVVGCGLTGTGDGSIENILKNVIEWFAGEIDSIVNEEEVTVIIKGHSRGGVTATKFAKFLRECRTTAKLSLSDMNNYSADKAKIINWMKNKKIKITLSTSDAYYGPTAKGENSETDAADKKEDGDENVVILATDTMFNCTPLMIKNADHVVISKGGHNYAGRLLNWKDFKAEKKVLLVKKGSMKYDNITSSKNDVIKLYDAIKDTYKPRRNVIMLLVCMKLNIKPDQLIEWIPDYKENFKKVLSSIEESKTLRGAFTDAFSLFDDKDNGLFYSLIHKTPMLKGEGKDKKLVGKFYGELSIAQDYCEKAGLTNSKQEKLVKAIDWLKQVILRKDSKESGKNSYKAALASALILKIYSKLNEDSKKSVDSKIIERCKK